jgi:hypothetical protein
MRRTLSRKSRREFLRSMLASGIALGVSPSRLSAQPVRPVPLFTDAPTDPYTIVDPELVPALKALPKLVLNSQTLPTIRQQEVEPPPLPPRTATRRAPHSRPARSAGVAADHRLAPKTRFPGSLEDN